MELASYVGHEADAGWALQQNSPYIHQLEADQAGIKQSVARIKVDRGDELVADPVLGMLLVGHNRITHLSPGQPNQLQLVDVADQRIGRSRGIKKTNLHRLATVDLDRSGLDELVIFDDLEHRLTVVGCESGPINPLISWPVFDDKRYPYDDESENRVREPRVVVGADFDGDKRQDLAMICHDRLIFYLAKLSRAQSSNSK